MAKALSYPQPTAAAARADLESYIISYCYYLMAIAATETAIDKCRFVVVFLFSSHADK